MPFSDYNRDRGLIIDVDLRAPPAERWCEAARRIGNEVHQLAVDMTNWCRDSFPRGWPPWLRMVAETALRGAADFTGRAVDLAAFALGHEYVKEIRCIAEKSDVSYPQLLLANVMYDLAVAWKHLYPSACSSFSCNLPNGEPVLARTLDWGIPRNLGRYTMMVFYHRGRKRYLSVGLTGFVGVLSAMRPAAWAVALNQAPARRIPVQMGHMPACIRLRAACDASENFDTLVRRMKRSETLSPFFAHIVGVKPREHIVIRAIGRHHRQRHMDYSIVVQTNHFVSAKYADLNDLSASYEFSRLRYEELKNRLRKELPRNVEDAFGVLSGMPITNARTIQAMALCPASGEWRLRYRE